jgi:hypothetical protein
MCGNRVDGAHVAAERRAGRRAGARRASIATRAPSDPMRSSPVPSAAKTGASTSVGPSPGAVPP